MKKERERTYTWGSSAENIPNRKRKVKILPYKLEKSPVLSNVSRTQEFKINSHFSTKEKSEAKSIEKIMLKTVRETGTKTPIARTSREQESNKSPIFRPLHHFFSAEKFKSNIFKSFNRKIDISKTPARKKDSFEERYSPDQHAFFHNLIGKVSLPKLSFRMTDIYLKDKLPDLLFEDIHPITPEFQEPKSPNFTENPLFSPLIPINPIPSPKVHDFILAPPISNKFTKIRKLLSSLHHYEQLGLHKLSRNRVFQFFPGVPYGLPQSKDFMKACKNGETYKVQVMLEKNKWLAHIFDYSGQTPLHWAVIRNNIEITEILLKTGSYVDVGDYVFFI